MIYDAFLFFNELDLLDLRLNILSPVVDRFVISESRLTFSGKPKPLYFYENRQRFSQFLDRIDHHVVDDDPDDFTNLDARIAAADISTAKGRATWHALARLKESTHFEKTEKHWGRDFYQREILLRALSHCRDEDLILVSDLDEIPNPQSVIQLKKNYSPSQLYVFRQSLFYYFVNCFKEEIWHGTRACSYRRLRNHSPNYDRMHWKDHATVVENAGWHFSFLGGADRIRTKIECYGHQELNTDAIKARVEQHLANNTDLFGRVEKIRTIPITPEYLPEFLVNNIHKYGQFVRPQ